MPEPFYVNGRFLTQQLSGVQRAALETTTALARLARFEILTPPGADGTTTLPTIPQRHVGRFSGQLWEQLDLPIASRGRVLVNLGNLAPVLRGNEVVVVHDLAVFSYPEAFSTRFVTWYRLVLRLLARRGVQFVTDSMFSGREITRYLGVPPDRIVIAHLGADHVDRIDPDESVLRRYGLEPMGYVLAVGGASRRKNLANVAQAMSQLGRAGLKLVSAGGYDPRIARPDGTSESTVRLGHVNDHELKALYQSAACLAFPSFHEGFGLPALEAMMASCPVVVSRAGALPEVCGKAATYCDAADPADIARAIDRAADPAHRASLVKAGLTHARQFTWERCAESLLGAIRQAGVS